MDNIKDAVAVYSIVLTNCPALTEILKRIIHTLMYVQKGWNRIVKFIIHALGRYNMSDFGKSYDLDNLASESTDELWEMNHSTEYTGREWVCYNKKLVYTKSYLSN